MAKVYTVKIFGNKRRYKKVGNKYFQIMKDGKLNKDSASGAWRLQLENSENSRLVSTPSKTFKNIQSLAKASLNKNKRGQALASTPKDDGGKAVKDFKRDIGFAKDGGKSGLDKNFPNRNVALKKKALSVIKKDANIKTDSKPLIKKKVEKKVEKKKYTKPLQKTQTKTIKSTKTKALQNKPKQDVKKKVDKKKTESKLDSKGNYKGTNIKPTKLQLERLKKRGLA